MSGDILEDDYNGLNELEEVLKSMILVVWDNYPDEVILYTLPDEYEPLAAACNGHYLGEQGCKVENEILQLSDILAEKGTVLNSKDGEIITLPEGEMHMVPEGITKICHTGQWL